MSPNGRRAWRKWAKRRRRRMNAHHRALYTGAKMRKAQPVQLAMQIPKPFTLRSLVGMTQGARKRAIRRVLRSEMPSCYRIPGAFYRIGQKLRPCPGCKVCGFPPPYGKLWEFTRKGWRMGSLVVSNTKRICDGSGVLPARNKGNACLHRGITP